MPEITNPRLMIRSAVAPSRIVRASFVNIRITGEGKIRNKSMPTPMIPRISSVHSFRVFFILSLSPAP